MDQIGDRVITATFHKDFRGAKIFFETPFLISSRLENGAKTIENLANHKEAEKDNYPKGAYGYSQ
jgi:hypothetical protein